MTLPASPHSPHSPHRPVALAGAALALAAMALAAGCGSSSATSTSPNPTSANPTTATPAVGATLTATLTEFHIAMSAPSVPAGSYTIKVSNAGNTLHALDVAGPGGTVGSSGSVLPGQTATVSVTLASGTYHVYCPVANHRAMGMDTVLTVTPAAGTTSPAAGTTSPAAGTSSGGGY